MAKLVMFGRLAPVLIGHHASYRKLINCFFFGKRTGKVADRQWRTLLKGYGQQKQVNIFFGRIQTVDAEIYGCYAGGSDDADKVAPGIQPISIDLNGEAFDANLNLGVMVYYIRASQTSVFMFDTSTAKVLADSCNKELQQQTGFRIDKVILSHEHQDHIAGRYAESLKRVPVVAQDLLVERYKTNGNGNVALGKTDWYTFQMHDGLMNVTNVRSHTELGTIAMINGVALVGDELESTLNFLVSKNTKQQDNELQESENVFSQNGIQKILPAHGSAAALFGGQFTLELLHSNRKYLQLMTIDAQSVCAIPENRQQKGHLKSQLAEQIGVKPNDITDAYFGTHINENCEIMGASAGQFQEKQPTTVDQSPGSANTDDEL